jgi:hypothetical protein
MPIIIDMRDQVQLTPQQETQLEDALGYTVLGQTVCGERRRQRNPTRYLPCLLSSGHQGTHSTTWPGQRRSGSTSTAEDRVMESGPERQALELQLGHVICGSIRRLRNPTRYHPCLLPEGHGGNHATTGANGGLIITGPEMGASGGGVASATVIRPTSTAPPTAEHTVRQRQRGVEPAAVAAAPKEYCDLCGEKGPADTRKNLGGIHACWKCLEYPSSDAFQGSCNELQNGALCRLINRHGGTHQFSAAY